MHINHDGRVLMHILLVTFTSILGPYAPSA